MCCIRANAQSTNLYLWLDMHVTASVLCDIAPSTNCSTTLLLLPITAIAESTHEEEVAKFTKLQWCSKRYTVYMCGSLDTCISVLSARGIERDVALYVSFT